MKGQPPRRRMKRHPLPPAHEAAATRAAHKTAAAPAAREAAAALARAAAPTALHPHPPTPAR